MKLIYKSGFFLLIIGSIFLSEKSLNAQTQYSDFKGSHYDAQAGAAVLMGSPMAIHTNPADLIYSPNFAATASAKNYFFAEDDVWSGILSTSFALSKRDATAVSVSSIGNSASRVTAFSAAYAHKLDKNMGLGVTFHGQQYSVLNYDNQWSGAFDLGFRAAVYNFLHLEASIHNPYEVGNIDYDESRSSLNLQILYEVSESVNWTSAFKKSWQSPLSFHTGVSFAVVKNLFLYAGAGISPVQFSMGLSYNFSNFHVFTASRYQSPLGFSPSMQLGYKSDK